MDKLIKVIRSLLGQRRNTNERNQDQETAFISAIWKNDLKTLEKLLKKQMNPNLQDQYGHTLIYSAINGNNLNALKLLLNHIDVNVQDQHGQSPIHIAIHYNNVEAMKLLIDYQANINVQSRHGQCAPLHIAAYYNDTEATKLLLNYGAEINIQDQNGRTPIYWAAYKRNKKASELIITYALKKHPKTRKPYFFEQPEYNDLSAYFDLCKIDIERMKLFDISNFQEKPVSLYELFYAKNKDLLFLSDYVERKKCLNKIQQHACTTSLYTKDLNQNFLKLRNMQLGKNKFAELTQDQVVNFNDDVVNEVFSYLDNKDTKNFVKAFYKTSKVKKLGKTLESRRKRLNPL